MGKMNVLGTVISYYQEKDDDYISLTDMVKNIENGLALIEKWLRNKNTIEFLGIWEEMYNPNFNSPEFEGIKNQESRQAWLKKIKIPAPPLKAETHRKSSHSLTPWVGCLKHIGINHG